MLHNYGDVSPVIGQQHIAGQPSAHETGCHPRRINRRLVQDSAAKIIRPHRKWDVFGEWQRMRGFLRPAFSKIIQKRSGRNVTGKQTASPTGRGRKRSLNRRILGNTTLNILILVLRPAFSLNSVQNYIYKPGVELLLLIIDVRGHIW